MIRAFLFAVLLLAPGAIANADCPPATGNITGPTFRYCIADPDPDVVVTMFACLALAADDATDVNNRVVCETLTNGETSAPLSVPTPMLCDQESEWLAYAYGINPSTAVLQISLPSTFAVQKTGVPCGDPNPPVVLP